MYLRILLCTPIMSRGIDNIYTAYAYFISSCMDMCTSYCLENMFIWWHTASHQHDHTEDILYDYWISCSGMQLRLRLTWSKNGMKRINRLSCKINPNRFEVLWINLRYKLEYMYFFLHYDMFFNLSFILFHLSFRRMHVFRDCSCHHEFGYLIVKCFKQLVFTDK